MMFPHPCCPVWICGRNGRPFIIHEQKTARKERPGPGAIPRVTRQLVIGLIYMGGLSVCVHAQTTKDVSFGTPLIERVEITREPAQPEIHLIMRLPKGHTAEHPTAKGVLAFCTWQGEADALRGRLANDSDGLVAYAEKHQLALLTWNTATLWTTGKSYDQVARQTLREQDDRFYTVVRFWKVGVGKLCREFGLPEDGFLLYGFSRGAHWSSRLALRVPEKFLAVYVHVANSYDKPMPSAGKPLWLVSSGDLDRGRDNAIAFYRECREKGFPMVLKVQNGLGHAESGESRKLLTEFFDYALEVQKRAKATKRTPAEVMLEKLATSKLTGDLLSQEVIRGEDVEKIPKEQRVKLPNEEFARAWGFLRK